MRMRFGVFPPLSLNECLLRVSYVYASCFSFSSSLLQVLRHILTAPFSAILGPEDEIPAVPYSRKVQDDWMRCGSGMNLAVSSFANLLSRLELCCIQRTGDAETGPSTTKRCTITLAWFQRYIHLFGFDVSMLTTSPRMVFGDSTPSGEEGGAPAPTSNAANTILAQRAARQAASQPTPSTASAATT
jgi:hypothetical protein